MEILQQDEVQKLNLVKCSIFNRRFRKNTVSYQEYMKQKEPEVLPSQYPNILVNGAGDLQLDSNKYSSYNGEIINGTIAFINNKDITISPRNMFLDQIFQPRRILVKIFINKVIISKEDLSKLEVK